MATTASPIASAVQLRGIRPSTRSELFEFAVFTHPAATGIGAYQDTVGDLAMDMLAAVAAGAVIGASSQTSASSRRSKIGT